ncbi:MAG: type II toxin-antitoxin system RelE/ParE family toxin [Methylobacter sp.]
MPVWKPKAEEDLQDIIDYIAKDKPRAAIELGDRLIEKAALLDSNPDIGRSRTKNTRVLVAHPHYVLIYRKLDSGTVEILRVKHAKRKFPRTNEK